MNYLSVCSGIEAATQAWAPLGWKPVAFSEIAPFPSAVLAHRYPDVPNWGDMTKYKDWPDATVDVLCGGTPCQSFSVAGLRQGLADPRGNLMLTFGAIAARYRPRWLVWENVPGVLSSDGGRDLASFLGLITGRSIAPPVDGWRNSGIIPGIDNAYGVAWRVLDAQHVRTRRFPFAVPQRRRRVFVVGYIGDWRRAAAVLFDRESLSGHPAPRRQAGQIVAPSISARPTGGGGLGTDFDLDGGLITQDAVANSGDVGYCLTASAQGSLDAETETETLIAVAHTLRGEGHDASEDGTGRGVPLVPIAIQERAICENPNAGPDGAGVKQDGTSYTLEARATQQAVAYRTAGDGAVYEEGDAVAPLTTGTDSSASIVAFALNQIKSKTNRSRPDPAVHHTLPATSRPPHLAMPWAVRRLTPIECERLQGFPNNFTRIPRRGKPADRCPDGPRYKAMGNSWAVNAAAWIGERIADVSKWK